MRVMKLVLAGFAVAVAIYLARVHAPIGLDFAGGALVELAPSTALADPEAVGREVASAAGLSGSVVSAGDDIVIALDDGDRADVDALDTAALRDGRVHVIRADVNDAGVRRAFGRPLGVAIAIASALLWLGALVRPRLAIAAAAMLAWAVAVADLLRIGGTLTLAVHATGMLVALPVGLATYLAHRRGRARAAWPGLVGLGVLFAASGFAARVHLVVDGTLSRPLWFGLRFASHACVPAVVLALACAATSSARDTRAPRSPRSGS